MILEVLPEIPRITTESGEATERQWLLELTEGRQDDRRHLGGILSLLDEIGNQARHLYGIASLLEPEADEP